MFRFVIAAAVIALSTGHVLANGHGGGEAPAAPKAETVPAPARYVLTKHGPKLVDLKGMTLYFYARDTSGKTSSCDGKCAEAWIPLAAPANAQATGDFTPMTAARCGPSATAHSTRQWPTRRRAKPMAQPRRCNGASPGPRIKAGTARVRHRPACP